MKYIFEEAFHELLEMEQRGLVTDEDASLEMLMMYFGFGG